MRNIRRMRKRGNERMFESEWLKVAAALVEDKVSRIRKKNVAVESRRDLVSKIRIIDR